MDTPDILNRVSVPDNGLRRGLGRLLTDEPDKMEFFDGLLRQVTGNS